LVDSYCLKVEKYLTKPLEVWRFVSNGLWKSHWFVMLSVRKGAT
jgi:hypothetical protein